MEERAERRRVAVQAARGGRQPGRLSMCPQWVQRYVSKRGSRLLNGARPWRLSCRRGMLTLLGAAPAAAGCRYKQHPTTLSTRCRYPSPSNPQTHQ